MSADAALVLASASPRRRELLDQLGLAYRVVVPAVDESVAAGERADAYVARVALAKARAGVELDDGALPVLGADTSVVVDDDILGKPRDEVDAHAMLARLAGRDHTVISAVAMVHEGVEDLRLQTSRVWFRAITRTEMHRYWASGEPADKAGAYAIQGLGAVFVARIEGSYSGVMGLPLFETAELLTRFAVPMWNHGG